VIVGQSFAERKDVDAFYQWPFASFSGEGCSQWLTDQLDSIEVGEDQILWLNADQDLSILYNLNATKIVALGNEAYDQLYRLKIPAQVVPHPQSWKRLNARQPYPLLSII
jgi:hypothetical protein